MLVINFIILNSTFGYIFLNPDFQGTNEFVLWNNQIFFAVFLFPNYAWKISNLCLSKYSSNISLQITDNHFMITWI